LSSSGGVGAIGFEEGSQLKALGENCFAECGIAYILVPDSFEVLGRASFETYETLEEVKFGAKFRLKHNKVCVFLKAAQHYFWLTMNLEYISISLCIIVHILRS
jgi:hypothetical protein